MAQALAAPSAANTPGMQALTQNKIRPRLFNRVMAVLSLLPCIVLLGCVTAYTPIPKADSDAAIVSTRVQFGPISNVQVQRIEVIRADGQFQLPSLGGSADTTLKPGPRVLEVKATFGSWPTAPDVFGAQIAYLTLPVTVEAAHSYRLAGEPRGRRYFLWLEDAASGTRVGNEVSERYAPLAFEFHYLPIPKR